MCSDERQKGLSEIWLDKLKFFGKNGRSEIGVQFLRSKCAVMNFS